MVPWIRMADIAICSECSGEMDVSAAAPFNRVSCPQCGAEVRVKVDFGAYLLERRLAYGGMSVVFVARDQTLGREVALKVLNEDYSQDELRTSQFEKEAELTALVSHPNVVRVYSVGRAFERFFIAMELISGESLEKILETGKPMPEKQVLQIGRQVVDGLRAAKDSGLIHRDIKPGNILLDDRGNAKIVDFGLSLVTQGGLARATEIFATPYYAPPEALEGGEEDFRSDIYALGASLYHALSGRPPIDNKSTNTKVLLEVKRNIPPLKKVAPEASRATAALIARAMGYQRSDRFSSYQEFLDAIDSAIAQKELPEGPREQAARRSSSRWPMIVGGLVLLGLVVMGLLVMNGNKEKDEPAVRADSAGSVVAEEAEAVSDAQKISRIYLRAQGALQSGDFSEAENNFLRLYRMKNVPEPTPTWAGFEAGLAALLEGRSNEARLTFTRLSEHLKGTELDAGTKVLLEDLLQDWDSLEPYPLPANCPQDVEKALVEFARALKNWEQGQVQAAQFFQTFAQQTFLEQKDWISSYQAWAQKLAGDAHKLAEGTPDWSISLTREEAVAELARLTSLADRLETSGRAQFVVRSWQEWIRASAEVGENATWQESTKQN